MNYPREVHSISENGIEYYLIITDHNIYLSNDTSFDNFYYCSWHPKDRQIAWDKLDYRGDPYHKLDLSLNGLFTLAVQDKINRFVKLLIFA